MQTRPTLFRAGLRPSTSPSPAARRVGRGLLRWDLDFEENLRPGGTNGYTTSWGTNAHGKLAGCPPSRP